MRKPAKHCFAGGCPALSLERTGEDFNRGRFAPMRFAYLLRTILTANALYVKLPLRFPFLGQASGYATPKKRIILQPGRLRLFASSLNLSVSWLSPSPSEKCGGGKRHIPQGGAIKARRCKSSLTNAAEAAERKENNDAV